MVWQYLLQDSGLRGVVRAVSACQRYHNARLAPGPSAQRDHRSREGPVVPRSLGTVQRLGE
jgi:hypothetical protein